jgi:hypothetical protein
VDIYGTSRIFRFPLLLIIGARIQAVAVCVSNNCNYNKTKKDSSTKLTLCSSKQDFWLLRSETYNIPPARSQDIIRNGSIVIRSAARESTYRSADGARAITGTQELTWCLVIG